MPRDPADTQLQEEEEEEDAADLPSRQAMSLLDPSSLLGAGALPVSPTSGSGAPTPTDGAAAPAPGPSVPLPQLTNLPDANPGGTYQPTTGATSQT
jgi:hypothetical protein